MPKGKVMKGGYSTVDPSLGGLDYKDIAEKMSVAGDTMNHATARNVFLRAMRKIVSSVCKVAERQVTDDDVTSIAKSAYFQSAIQGIMHDRKII